MKLLLDTHAFLWFVWDDPRLSEHAATLREDVANERYLSLASVWEIAIKIGAGKLTLAQPIDIFLSEQLANNDINLRPIALPHAFQVAALPLHHRDPFDRLLISQSLAESMPLVSADPALETYGIQRLW